MNIRRLLRLSLLGFTATLFTSTPSLADKALPHLTPYWPDYPTVDYGTGEQAKHIQHGEYLVKLGDCISCHTNTTQPNSPVFGGGLGMKTPFGVFYTPNITPDKETGLGNWSFEDFRGAMHRGKRPDGSNNFPVFPYLWFTRITDDDLRDIKAYLDKIPAVHAPKRKDDVPFPFNVRFAQTFWKILFFKKGYYQPDPKQSAQWNRGAYIVEGLAHCGMCHTPINFLGGPKNRYKFTGNLVDGMLAPNISGPALADIPVEQIVRVFSHGKMIRGGEVAGPMLEVDHNSLSHLSEYDLQAIALYIKSVQSKQPPKKAITGTGLEAGKAVYEQSCYACHNTGASGAPKLGSTEDWSPLLALGKDKLYQNAIQGINAMPPKGTCVSCTDQQIKDTVDYMISMAQPGASAPTLSFGRPDQPPASLTLKDGERIYEKNCASCHSTGRYGAPQVGSVNEWTPLLRKGIAELVQDTLYKHGKMPPMSQICPTCNDADIKAAVVFMAQQSKEPDQDYKLWLSN